MWYLVLSESQISMCLLSGNLKHLYRNQWCVGSGHWFSSYILQNSGRRSQPTNPSELFWEMSVTSFTRPVNACDSSWPVARARYLWRKPSQTRVRYCCQLSSWWDMKAFFGSNLFSKRKEGWLVQDCNYFEMWSTFPADYRTPGLVLPLAVWDRWQTSSRR